MKRVRDGVDDSPAGLSHALSLSLLYGAMFLVIGIQLPYWSVWLKDRGVDESGIGLLLSISLAVRIVASPAIAHIVDRMGERRRPLIFLAFASFAVFALFHWAHDFWSLMAVTVLTAVFFPVMMPLSENLTMTASQRENLDYGRIRLWGSITFIVASVAGGQIIQSNPPAVLWLILAAAASTIVATFLLPDIRPGHHGDHKQAAENPPIGDSLAAASIPADKPGIIALVRHPAFFAFMFAAAMIQASHAVYYGFGTLNWQAQGFDGHWIGLLWAEGVIAEIILFAYGGKFVSRAGPGRLLVMAAVAGIIRWTILGIADNLAALVLVQILHAFTFGACHLAAMQFVARAAPARLSATAQSIYSSVAMGIALGLALLLAGFLFERFGAVAYIAMAGLSVIGLFAAIALLQIWNGKELFE